MSTQNLVECIDRHDFVPGDGVKSYVDVCQTCGSHLSEHEFPENVEYRRFLQP